MWGIFDWLIRRRCLPFIWGGLHTFKSTLSLPPSLSPSLPLSQAAESSSQCQYGGPSLLRHNPHSRRGLQSSCLGQHSCSSQEAVPSLANLLPLRITSRRRRKRCRQWLREHSSPDTTGVERVSLLVRCVLISECPY